MEQHNVNLEIDNSYMITHMAVNPQGKVIGPTGDAAFVKEALIIGFRRAGEKPISRLDAWTIIKQVGYRIVKVGIIFKEEVDI